MTEQLKQLGKHTLVYIWYTCSSFPRMIEQTYGRSWKDTFPARGSVDRVTWCEGRAQRRRTELTLLDIPCSAVCRSAAPWLAEIAEWYSRAGHA